MERTPRLLADPMRWPVAIAALVWLVFIGWDYARFSMNQHPGFAACVSDPVACDGASIVLPLWKVIEVDEGRYVLYKASGPVPVAGPTSDLQVGDTVSVRGHVDAARQVVVEEDRQIHTLRWAKELLSGLGVLGMLVWLPFAFRLRAGGVSARG